MNDERSASAAGLREAASAAPEVIAHFAAPDRPAAPVVHLPDSQPLTHREKRLIVISMMLPVFLGSVDQSILASALPTIGRSLGDMHNLPWLITAFLIASTALTPLYGKFADIHGRRAAMLIGLGIYMAGSLVSAASPNMLMLICGRVVQGCGAGGLTVTANMILGDIAAPKDRGKYYAYFSIAFTTAGGTGPALGGWISDHLHWSVIFLWNFPLCVLAVVLALTVLRRLPRHERPHRLDFIGAILVMAASSSFMLALNLGGVRYPWLSSPISGAAWMRAGAWRGFHRAASHRARTAHSDHRSCPIAPPAGDRGAFVRLGRDHLPQHFPADVSAKRAGLVADLVGIEPDDPDGHAQCQRRAFQPASRPRAALQALAARLSGRRHRRGFRAWRFPPEP